MKATTLALTLVALSLLVFMLLPQAELAGRGIENAVQQMGVYSDVPLTNHAVQGHKGQDWNVVTIKDYFDTGGCKPNIYVCEADDFEVHYCEMNPGKSIGMIIGHTVKVVVTGFMADTDYWRNRCTR